MIKGVKNWVRTKFYKLGLLDFFHRLRNRHTLTVLMFHRVLPNGSDALIKSEREFAFSIEGFSACLNFIQRHYVAVSFEEVKQARAGVIKLPACAVLVTFDDGWRDTLEFALPQLEQRNMPALLFLATEIPRLTENRWWQDRLVEAMQRPDVVDKLAEQFGLSATSFSHSALVRELTARVAELNDGQRHTLLDAFVPREWPERQMLQKADLNKLTPLLAIGGHGHCHGPLTTLSDTASDLENCHRFLEEANAASDTLSFPHGAYDEKVLAIAIRSGFNNLFSSDPYLVSLSNKARAKPVVMGRIHIPENEWTCDTAGISPSKLATFLFFRKHA